MRTEQGRLSLTGQWEFVVSSTDTYSPEVLTEFLPVSGYFISNLIEYDGYSTVPNVIINMVRSDRVYSIGFFDTVIVCIQGVCDPNPPYITSASPLPTATVNQPYTYTFSVTGGRTPFGWSNVSGALPQGLTLAPASGVISGMPSQGGAFAFRVRVTDSQQRAVVKDFTLISVATPAQPDFAVTGITFSPSVPNCGQTFTAYVTVTNRGSGSGNGGDLDVWVSQASSVSCSTGGNQFQPVGTLAAGSSKTMTFSGLTAPASGVPWTFRAFVDSFCQTTESNDGNNQATASYGQCVQPPDFLVTGISFSPPVPVGGQPFTAYVTVTNQGIGSGNGGDLDVWVNQASSVSCGTAGNQFQSVGTLAAGASRTMTFSGLTAPASGAPWTFRAFVDSFCQTTESNGWQQSSDGELWYEPEFA